MNPETIKTKHIEALEQMIAKLKDPVLLAEQIHRLEAQLESIRKGEFRVSWTEPKPFLRPHPLPATLRVTKPGDALAVVVHQITGALPCGGCNSMRKQMNDWGWMGCWQRRDEICAWLQQQARQRGVVVEKATVMGLLVSAIKTAWHGMPETEEHP
jgi:hypothetical protein